MKKSFIMLVIGIAATLVGCKPNYYYDYTTNNYYEGGEECYCNRKVINLTVKKEDWNWNPGDSFIWYKLPIPELTKEVYDRGSFQCYIEIQGYTQPFQIALPTTRYLSWNDDGQDIFYSEKIEYIAEVGAVEFDIDYSDLTVTEEAFQDYKFRLVLQW